MRQGDKLIMNVFHESGIWQMKQLIVLQCLRRHKIVYAFADTIECVGRTAMTSMRDDSEGTSEWIFSKEKLQNKDFDL